MKNKLIVSFITCFILFISFSCQKQGIEKKEEQSLESSALHAKASLNPLETTKLNTISFKVKPIHPKQIHDIAMKLQEKIKKTKRVSTSRMIEDIPTDEEIILTDDPQEISTIINPLVQNGQQVYNELVSQLQNSYEWTTLSEEDRTAILNFNSESQFTDLALIYSTTEFDTNLNLEVARIDAGVIKDCVSTAIGIDAISSLISNTAALKTVSGAIQILKIVGKRYLNYIGIAWMIWDFTDCISHFI